MIIEGLFLEDCHRLRKNPLPTLKNTERVTVYDKVIQFMIGKTAKIREFSNIEFFTNADASSIYEMDEEKLETTWAVIKKYIQSNGGGLYGMTCPFCIYHKDNDGVVQCYKYEYGENHGVCESSNSDWAIVQRNFKIIVRYVLTNEFYRGLVKEIEAEND